MQIYELKEMENLKILENTEISGFEGRFLTFMLKTAFFINCFNYKVETIGK